jgi:hypothetical protein
MLDIFEKKTGGHAITLCMFDNAPSHRKRADNMLSAREMPALPSTMFKNGEDTCCMCNGWFNRQLADGTVKRVAQSFYFEDDHGTHPSQFKGMAQIVCERGLWPAKSCKLITRGKNKGQYRIKRPGKLNGECKGFKCKPGATACCCHRILFLQPNFVQQKPKLAEYIEKCGHICDFYLKYHCELNFIKQYWGAAKYQYRGTPCTHLMDKMRENVQASLDNVPLSQIQRCVSPFTLSDTITHILPDTQIAWPGSCTHTSKDLRGVRLRGPTSGTTAIVHSLL